MIGVLIVAHDQLAESLAGALTHVLGGRPAQLEAQAVAARDDPLELLPQVQQRIGRLDTGEGVLIFADIYGATPCNLVAKLVEPGRIEAIAGASLPMLVRAFTYRGKGMAAMIEKAVSGGCDGVLRIGTDPVHAATRG